uniref:Ninjurin 2 n=1 Tax=Anser cygnoides TaxID=8845 RepID=A0A8B9D2Q5_ANSCY
MRRSCLMKGTTPHLRMSGPMNINHYATKKSVAESMLDVALFMANVTQLKAVLEQGTSFQYYITLIVLISISLFFQVVIGILLIISGKVAVEMCMPLHGAAGKGVGGRSPSPQPFIHYLFIILTFNQCHSSPTAI